MAKVPFPLIAVDLEPWRLQRAQEIGADEALKKQQLELTNLRRELSTAQKSAAKLEGREEKFEKALNRLKASFPSSRGEISIWKTP